MTRPAGQSSGTGKLVLGAIGVVYGDIGTSPLYAIKETFGGHHPLVVDAGSVMGVLSLMFWTVMLLVSVKYVAIMMRADNRGEGGSLALLALVSSLTASKPRLRWGVTMLGICAAALFYGDSMITPAISVLSAVEGLELIAPAAEHYVIPLAAAILTVLFAVQRRGTGAVGLAFGPIMVTWFAVLAVLGGIEIYSEPQVLLAVNPAYALAFVAAEPLMAFLALGTIVLAVTGGEALYTDMGHFGRFPIRVSWFGLVMPALMVNYFGQGALLLGEPAAVDNPFYRLVPEWGQLPMILLATMATVIASQAVISGAFSVARQAIQMGLLPRMKLLQTSSEEQGQIYCAFTNWSIYVAVMALVVGFGNSSDLAAAYGIAVTGTMLIDTILVGFVIVLMWKWPRPLAFALLAVFFLADLAYFSANALKIPQGGWFPLAIGALSFTILTTWRKGRMQIFEELEAQSIPLEVLIKGMAADVHRVEGTAVFMTSHTQGAPSALLHNLKHNQVLHQRNVLLTVKVSERPHVLEHERVRIEPLSEGFYRVIVNYGFMDAPDVPSALALCAPRGLKFDMMSTSFFVSRETVIPSPKIGMVQWRERLFAWMSRNAMSATDYFHIPTNRVVELGTQIEI